MICSEKISDAELEVMKVLWASGNPLSEREIIDILNQEINWHRATIQTLIRRLCEKGAVHKERKDLFLYSAILSEEEYARERTANFLNKVYGGSARNLVSAMLSSDILSEKDVEELQNYWKERKKKNE